MPRNPWDIDNDEKRLWEETLPFSEPFDFSAIETSFPQEGAFWEALNIGVTKKAWQLAFDLFCAFDDLQEKEKKAFLMWAMENKSYREIGRELDVTHRTVGRMITRVQERLRDRLGPHWIHPNAICDNELE